VNGFVMARNEVLEIAAFVGFVLAKFGMSLAFLRRVF
jgi:hypothetical protein